MTRVARWTAVVASMMIATRGAAQVTSTLQSISLAATVNQTVAISAPTPASQSVSLVEGQTNQFSAPFSMSVSWDVTASTATTVKLVAYFPTPSAALVNGGDAIASSRIEVSTDGTTWHPLTGSAVGGAGTAGGSYVLYTSPVTSGGNKRGTASVTFSLRVNLTGVTNTAAGVYSGIMNLIAICS